jgi:hypothetical protein
VAGFQLVGLDHARFEPLFELEDRELARAGILRRVVDEWPGFPCRVSLEDAPVGEEVLLLSWMHQPATSPYRASGPIFVRRGARQARLPPDVVPAYVTRRLISLRAYDAADLMVAAEVCEGVEAGARLAAQLDDPATAYVHLHNATRGCFSCLATRVADAGCIGGGSGIRTHGRLTPSAVFKTAALNRSAIPPAGAMLAGAGRCRKFPTPDSAFSRLASRQLPP